MSDLDFLIHVLNNLPEEYDVVLDGIESKLMLKSDNPKKLTIEEMGAKLNNRYDRLKGRAIEEKLHQNEVALYGAQFKGSCTRCGRQGHKGINYPVSKIVYWEC